MRKHAFCIYSENIGTNQLLGKHASDKRLCYHYNDDTIPLLPKSEI